MRRIFQNLIIVWSLGLPLCMLADDESTTISNEIEKQIPVNPKGPRMGTPTESVISCIYRGGSINIDFTDQNASSDKTITVTVYHDGQLIAMENHTNAPCIISIGNNPGMYQILIAVEEGDTYMGILEL